MAWAEGGSRKHETDIYEMMVFHYLGVDPGQRAAFNEAYVDDRANALGAEAAARSLVDDQRAAYREASRSEV